MIITLNKLAKFFVFASVFSVVVVMSGTFFPFIGGKYYFFRVCIELGLAFLLLWWAFEASAGELEERFRRMLRQPIFIATSVFVLAVLLSTLFAVNPHGAFWSNYERGEGGFQMLHYYAFFVLMALLFEHEKDWRHLFRISIVAGVGMIAYGLLAASLEPGFIGPYRADDGTGVFDRVFSRSRFQGSLGNPAYVAPYLLFIIFYTFWLWVHGRVTLRRNLWYGALAIFFLTFFILSQTRGAFLGLIASVIVFFGYLVFDDRRLRKIALIIIGIIFAAIVAVYSLFSGDDRLEYVAGGRLLNISLSAVSAQTRLWTWGSAWRGFLEHPVFGWGPENFSQIFDKHFDPRHYVPGQNSETWFDRAHSIVFDYLAMTGILGFGGLVAMFGAYFWRLYGRIRRERKSSEAQNREIGYKRAVRNGLLIAIPVGYLVQGMILFDVLPIYLNLFIMMAFGNFFMNHES
jgi:O-antigen ligase